MMRFFAIFSFLVFGNFHSSFAQINVISEPNVNLVIKEDSIPPPEPYEGAERHMWKISFFNPGAEFEKRIGHYTTFSVFSSISTEFLAYTTTNYGSGILYNVRPSADVEIREYFNYMVRKKRKNNTLSQSLKSDYICLSLHTFMPTIASNVGQSSDEYLIGPKYGFISTYDSGFFTRWDIGMGFNIWDEREIQANFMSNLSIGIQLKSKNNTK